MKRKGYKAVVESGSHDESYTWYEERITCGHLHRTIAAALKCGEKNYDAHYVNGSTWQACADWHGYTVHDQDGGRVDCEEVR